VFSSNPPSVPSNHVPSSRQGRQVYDSSDLLGHTAVSATHLDRQGYGLSDPLALLASSIGTSSNEGRQGYGSSDRRQGYGILDHLSTSSSQQGRQGYGSSDRRGQGYRMSQWYASSLLAPKPSTDPSNRTALSALTMNSPSEVISSTTASSGIDPDFNAIMDYHDGFPSEVISSAAASSCINPDSHAIVNNHDDFSADSSFLPTKDPHTTQDDELDFDSEPSDHILEFPPQELPPQQLVSSQLETHGLFSVSDRSIVQNIPDIAGSSSSSVEDSDIGPELYDSDSDALSMQPDSIPTFSGVPISSDMDAIDQIESVTSLTGGPPNRSALGLQYSVALAQIIVVCRHNQSIASSDTNTELCLQIIESFSPDPVTKWPRSFDDCLKLLNLHDIIHVEPMIMCPSCRKVYPSKSSCVLTTVDGRQVSKNCTNCKTALLQSHSLARCSPWQVMPSQKFFYIGLRKQLVHLLSRADIQECFWNYRKEQGNVPEGVYGDLPHGSVFRHYQTLQKDNSHDNWFSKDGEFDVFFQMNQDAFQPFDRTVYSVTALYVAIGNLPRQIRHHQRNMLLVCVIPGK
jgi:hypothetical protein